MSYQDEIDCPYCHKQIELEIEIEGDDGYMGLYPIVIPKAKGVMPIDKERGIKGVRIKNLERR